MAKVLYISYDGMCEPLGQSQVIAYLEGLVSKHRIHLMSFEKPVDLDDQGRMQEVRNRLDAAGIGWTPMRYHKRPSAAATLYDVVRGQAMALTLARRLKIDIVHVRSYVPALIGLPIKRSMGARFLFDIRGFWADERVDGSIWPSDGTLYRIAKMFERHFFRAADHVVTLTEASLPFIEHLGQWKEEPPPFTVIPTCADLDRFVPPTTLPEPVPFVYGYVGSFGTWSLMDETMAVFRALLERQPSSKMLFVNRQDHVAIRAAAVRAGIPTESIVTDAVSHDEVASRIQQMHAASSLYRQCFSGVSRSPTKLAEYLGCGVPCIGNTGVGDVESILEGDRTGVVLRSFDAASIAVAADRILSLAADPTARARCRRSALSRFSLERGVAAYDSIYNRLTETT
jgi:glycosyltransferase involved in cell wall biosynthesis